MNWHLFCQFSAFDAFNKTIMCITHAYHVFCTIFWQILHRSRVIKYRWYRVIIVSNPKISCNIVWIHEKDIVEGWSVALVKSSRVNIETKDSLWNLHFYGTILPNFKFSTNLTSLKPNIQGLFLGFFAFFPILRPW